SSSALRATDGWLHMGAIAPLAAIGIVVTAFDWRRLWVLHALLLSYAASVLLFFVTARYRYPLLPILILFAGAAIAHAWRQSLAQRRFRTVRIALRAGVATAMFANRAILDRGAMQASTLVNLGTELALRGDPAQAAQYFSRAIALEPDYADAHFNLGLALLDL